MRRPSHHTPAHTVLVVTVHERRPIPASSRGSYSFLFYTRCRLPTRRRQQHATDYAESSIGRGSPAGLAGLTQQHQQRRRRPIGRMKPCSDSKRTQPKPKAESTTSSFVTNAAAPGPVQPTAYLLPIWNISPSEVAPSDVPCCLNVQKIC